MSIGENIRNQRYIKGMTQVELARKCGMADSQLGAYERGEVVPKQRNVERIAKALEISVAELVRGTNKEGIYK